jgi:hypothetical protein
MRTEDESSTTRAEANQPKLCRYCRRFVGNDAKHGICGKCWELEEKE